MIYTEAENALLLDQLKSANYILRAGDFVALEDLWPGFFKGRIRKAYDLHIQTVSLAQKNILSYQVHSIPKQIRIRNYRPKIPVVKHPKLSAQISCIIQNEFVIASRKATAKIMGLLKELSNENTELREENRRLRPFENIVRIKYQKELEFRTGQ